MIDETKEVQTEIVEAGALESISRAEIDVAISTARRYPRQLSLVKNKMLSFATLDQETAESCFYTLPRGGKNIQGPSVRLAEIAVSCYGNLRAGSRILQTVTEGPNPHVVVQAVAMDLENNIQVSIEKRRRITKKRNKDTIDEDDINLAANAGSAIAFRDAVFKVVPLALVKPVFEQARKTAIGDASTLTDRRAKCITTFGKMGVTPDKVLAKLGRASIEDVTLQDVETMIGLYNAIKEGEVEVDEAFPTPVKTPAFDGPPQAAAPAPAEQAKRGRPKAQAGVPVTAAQPAPAKPAEQPALTVVEQTQPVAPDDDPFAPTPSPEPEPAVDTPDPETLPAAQEPPELAEVRRLMGVAGVTDAQIIAFCVAKNLNRPDGKPPTALSELAQGRLQMFIKNLSDPKGKAVAMIKGG